VVGLARASLRTYCPQASETQTRLLALAFTWRAPATIHPALRSAFLLRIFIIRELRSAASVSDSMLPPPPPPPPPPEVGGVPPEALPLRATGRVKVVDADVIFNTPDCEPPVDGEKAT
jgi:hypothetical protein